MRDKGELVKRGNINEIGEIEFWDEASETAPRTQESVEKQLLEKVSEKDLVDMDYPEWKARQILYKQMNVHPGVKSKTGEEIISERNLADGQFVERG